MIFLIFLFLQPSTVTHLDPTNISNIEIFLLYYFFKFILEACIPRVLIGEFEEAMESMTQVLRLENETSYPTMLICKRRFYAARV